MEEQVENQAVESNVEAPAKKSTKKAVKKAAPKKATKKAAAKKEAPKGPVEISASSVKEGIKEFNKQGAKKGILKVNGKRYAVTIRNTWGITKTVLDMAKDGLVMAIKGKGHYLYPSKDFKDLFGKMTKTEAWKDSGSYAMSVLPVSHEEYFNK